MQGVDHGLQGSARDFTATPLLHVCNHLYSSQLLLFRLICYDDSILGAKYIYFLQEELERKAICVGIGGTPVTGTPAGAGVQGSCPARSAPSSAGTMAGMTGIPVVPAGNACRGIVVF